MTRKDSQEPSSYGKYPLLGSVLRSTSPAKTLSLFSSSPREELVVPPPISCLTSAVGVASTLLMDLDIEADSRRSPNLLTVSCNLKVDLSVDNIVILGKDLPMYKASAEKNSTFHLSTRFLLPKIAGDVDL